MNKKEVYLKVIDELFSSLSDDSDDAVLSKVYFTTITLLVNGDGSF